jgi:hypothetical protein
MTELERLTITMPNELATMVKAVVAEGLCTQGGFVE